MFRLAADMPRRIVIVDGRADDYRRVFAMVPELDGSLCFLTSGRAATRLPREDDLLWMINCKLPDASGFELLEVLKERLHRVPVIIVGDSYDVEDELRACRGGATLYLCKPLPMSVLDQWFGIRAPP